MVLQLAHIICSAWDKTFLLSRHSFINHWQMKVLQIKNIPVSLINLSLYLLHFQQIASPQGLYYYNKNRSMEGNADISATNFKKYLVTVANYYISQPRRHSVQCFTNLVASFHWRMISTESSFVTFWWPKRMRGRPDLIHSLRLYTRISFFFHWKQPTTPLCLPLPPPPQLWVRRTIYVPPPQASGLFLLFLDRQ